MMVWSAVAPEITDAQQYQEINRIGPSALDQQRIGPKFLHDMGYKTWAVIHDTTAYGNSLDKYFKGFLDEAGGEIVGTFGVAPDQQDFSVEVTKIASLKPQVVYIEALAPVAVRVKLQMDKTGFHPQFDSVSGVFADEFINNLGPSAEGSLSRRNGAPIEELAGGKEFLAQYETRKYSQPPDVWGHFAFAEANMLIDIIEQVGPDREKIKRALRDVKDHPTMLGPVTFNENGQNIHSSASVVVVQDGKWTSWDKSEYASGKRKLKNLP
jgi:branched-chain amino acid transport system substrate-binding protein